MRKLGSLIQQSHGREQVGCSESGPGFGQIRVLTDHRWVLITLGTGPQSDEAPGGMGSELFSSTHFIPLHPHPVTGTPALTAQQQGQEMA